MNKKVWIAITIGLWLVALATSHRRCRSAWWSYGIDVRVCPEGTPRSSARLDVTGLRRGAPGQVSLQALAHYTTHEADGELRAVVGHVTAVELSLIGARGAVAARAGEAAGAGGGVGRAAGGAATWPLEASDWERAGGAWVAKLVLPVVPDGDYQLHASYETPLGKGEVSVPVALYTPARIHVITDRPLYEPGNTVRFRAVVLRARDLVPLDHRPGSWSVRDPSGEVLLDEAAPAGEWGVVAGSFPLDRVAATGEWKVAWRSADAVDEVSFTVEPFTLPRFRVDAIADRAFYQAGDRPRIKGAVLYSSGAPVGDAALDVAWEATGGWPPPVAWQASELPAHARTAANGRFELALPQIPADLQGTATLTARISAVDPAGDRATGVARVLLSQDAMEVSAVTELGDGLVESFNNRLYLRVATPDGRVIANTKITVARAWQPNDRGIEARLDEDGVASLQLDPGAPVNIVIPAVPWRPAPKQEVVARGETRELIGGEGAPLVDQVALDRWLPALAPCAKWVAPPSASAKLALRVDPAGAVIVATGRGAALEDCAARAVAGQRLPPGRDRLYAVDWQFSEPELPSLAVAIDGALDVPGGLEARLTELVRGTRDCLPATAGALGSLLSWRTRAGSDQAEITGWIADPAVAAAADPGERAPRAALACVTSRLARGTRLVLAERAAFDGMGVARFTVEPPATDAQPRPQPTTMLGYELVVTADLAGRGRASTKLRLAPGTVPKLRMRVTPVLPNPGEPVTAELIRGPQFTGTLPARLALDCLTHHVEVPLDRDRRAVFPLAGEVEGWCTASGGGARALVYVRPRAELTVSVVPGRERYAPGDKAELAIQTTLGGKGGPAAVGLFGVDDSLGQLVPLPGADALGRVRPVVETGSPAFGVLDGQALALGRIRGANAAAATVLRVTSIPTPPQLDAVVDGHAESKFDPIEELTDRFYAVLAELHAEVRGWEAKAPPAEKMTPATMARLWQAALAACAARGVAVTDAYGRTLRLSRLPSDLLSLTDPRAVVVVATRLTEDVENWPAWVAKEGP